jgi:hypothetical protein
MLCYNPILRFVINLQEIYQLFRVRSLFLFVVVLSLSASISLGQETPPKQDPAVAVKKEEPKPAATPAAFDPTKPLTAEQLVEVASIVYGGGGGKVTLNQIRKTTFERGRLSAMNADGKMENGTYQRWVLRGDSLGKEKVRFDQDLPSGRFSLVNNSEKVFGIFGSTYFAPRADVAKAFENTIFHGIEAFLRFKENESKAELAGKEKILGVEYHLVDVTDKQGRSTRFYISVRSFRVMMLTYEEEGIKYRRKFYNHNLAQGTLVPYRTTLTANDKLIEESEVGTITFGQRVDEELFKENKQ